MPIDHHRDPFDTAWRTEAILIRRRLIRLQDETRSLRHALARKYNPDQPRLPAGNPYGGRWTSGGGGGGAGSGSFADFGATLGLADYGGAAESWGGATPAIDPTGDAADSEPWSGYAETRYDDGSLASSGVSHRDGSRIYSEYAGSGERSDWDERHTVTLPEGSKVTFETSGRTQTIRDGGPDGKVLSRATWGDNGPEPEARVQQVLLPALAPLAWPAATAAGTILFGWLSLQNTPGGQQAVMAFQPREYRPAYNEGKIDLNFVTKLSNEEVELACRRVQVVQEFADRSAQAAGHPNQFPSMREYGKDVHRRFEKFVNDLNDPNFRAERSFMREGFEVPPGQSIYRGYPGSVRPDAYEYNRETGTLCLYDVKAGEKRGMTVLRSDTLTAASAMGFNDIRRIIMMEVRPRR